MTSAANAIDEEWVEKKLKGANSSQDSVQSLSLWALNHKTQHEKIVGIWFKVLKAAKIDLRLTLFYLCNEVVQTCKRKHAIVFKDAFKEVLKDAALLVRDHSIRPNIERIFKIWEERHVYNKEFVDELMTILSNTKVKSTMSTKLMAEFKPEELVRQLKRVAEKEEHVEAKRLQLPEQQWDMLDVESFKQQSKDRHECGQYVDQVNESRIQLESYVMDLQNEIQDRTILIQLLEESELFYEVQNSEANIVATAYKNFGSRVNTLHKKLHESRKPVKPLSPRIPPNSVGAAAKGKESKDSQSRRKEPDPGATPTEDEFDDDSCEGAIVNDSNQNFDSSTSSSESDEKKQESGARRNSREEQRSPEFSTDSVSGDAFSGLGSLLPNLFKGASTFLPSLASHGPQPTSADIHGFGLGAISNSIPPAADEDAGGATPVQDEEPNDDLPLRPMEFLKQVILDSTKSAARRPSTGSDHAHPFTSGHQVEMASSTTSISSATSWPGYVPNFSQPESHLGEHRVVYEGYDESYELIYPPGMSQELYDPEAVHTFELYTSAYGDQTDASQAYMLEAVPVEGYPCAGDGFDIEGYPAGEPDYQGAYQEQLMSTVVDETYVDGEMVYSVATGESYHQSQHISGSYIGVLEHVPGVPPQPPPVVYRALPSFTQPPPTFSHPPPSLAPSPSFSQPLPTLNQPTMTFITPSSFAGPPPSLTQPPPPLFTFPQNSTLPPMIPHSFVEPPPPPGSYRLLAPASAKAALGLQSPRILISSPLESPPSVRTPYRQQTALKPWMKPPYNQFKNDLGGRGLAVIRETGRFDDVSEISSDLYRLGRGQPITRRTNLTYLTEGQTNEDRNGKSGFDDHTAISSISTEEKSRYPSSALRSMSLPCDSFPFKSLPGDQDDRHQLSASPRSATISDALSKSQSFESLPDTLPVRTNSLDRDLRGHETDMMEISEVTQSDSGSMEKCTKERHSDSGQLKQNAIRAFSPTSSTACNIPSLGIPSSPRTFLAQRGAASRYPIRNCRPALSSVPALSSFRFRHDGARRFPRKPNFFAHRLPFQRNYPDGY